MAKDLELSAVAGGSGWDVCAAAGKCVNEIITRTAAQAKGFLIRIHPYRSDFCVGAEESAGGGGVPPITAPPSTRRPSGSLTCCPNALCDPSLAMYPLMVNSSPGLTESFRQPLRYRKLGAPAWTLHRVTLPSSLFTSSVM